MKIKRLSSLTVAFCVIAMVGPSLITACLPVHRPGDNKHQVVPQMTDPRNDANSLYAESLRLALDDDANNNARSIELLQTAVEKGHADATGTLAIRYQYGWGLEADAAKALQLAKAAAQAGSPHGEWVLGRAAFTGRATTEDHERADQHFVRSLADIQSSAHQGSAFSQFCLGYMHKFGVAGLVQDPDKGAELYRSAAEKGHVIAQFLLAMCHQNGEGVAKDYEASMTWFLKSAQQGYRDSQLRVGNLFANGEGVPRDDSEAVKWLRLAAAQGDGTAAKNIETMYRTARVAILDEHSADQLRQKYTPAWRITLNALGSKTPESASEYYALALGYECDGNPETDSNAVSMYQKASALGFGDATAVLSMRHRTGWGVRVDKSECLRLAHKAVEQGSKLGKYMLAVATGWGTELDPISYQGAEYNDEDLLANQVDEQAANRLFIESMPELLRRANTGDPWALRSAAFYYWQGKGGLKNNVYRAVEMYERAVSQGHPPSQCDYATFVQDLLFRVPEPGGPLESLTLQGMDDESRERARQSMVSAIVLRVQAARWRRIAAEAGYTRAKFLHAERLSIGSGAIHQDLVLASGLYKEAAHSGYANSLARATENESIQREFEEAVHYDFGASIEERDLVKAANLYKSAAERGHSIAQSSLYMICADHYFGYDFWKRSDSGQVIVQYLSNEPSSHDPIGRFYLGLYHTTRDGLQRLSEQGNHRAQLLLGKIVYAGMDGLAKDPAKGVALISSASDSGVAAAQYALARFHYEGIGGFQQDEQRAFELLTKAGKQGHIPAQTLLGFICLKRDEFAEADRWFELPSKIQDPIGLYGDGLLYMRHRKPDISRQRAYELATACFSTVDTKLSHGTEPSMDEWRASLFPNVRRDALFCYGLCLRKLGDPSRASTLFRLAAQAGHPDAEDQVKTLQPAVARQEAAEAIRRKEAIEMLELGDIITGEEAIEWEYKRRYERE